jgi:hypothetical protein
MNTTVIEDYQYGSVLVRITNYKKSRQASALYYIIWRIGLEVLTAVTMESSVLRVVTPCSWEKARARNYQEGSESRRCSPLKSRGTALQQEPLARAILLFCLYWLFYCLPSFTMLSENGPLKAQRLGRNIKHIFLFWISAHSPGVKRQRREADHLSQPSAEVKNGGAIPPLLPHVTMTQCLTN